MKEQGVLYHEATSKEHSASTYRQNGYKYSNQEIVISGRNAIICDQHKGGSG